MLPAVDRRGRHASTRRSCRAMAGDDPAADAATGARHALAPGPRHRPRPALGPDRGDLRRGPLPRRRAGLRLRPRRSRARPRGTASLATGKHMVGHGLAEGGLNQAPAHIGPRELRDEQLFPFEAAVRLSRHRQRDAGLLRRRRRALPRVARAADDDPARRMGVRRHRRVGLHGRRDALDAAPADGRPRRAPRALGARAPASTSSCPRTVAYGAPLAAALDDGRVDEALLDRAVERVLRMKFRLGLFERPYRRGPPSGATSRRSAPTRRGSPATWPSARSSCVENDGVLPLRPDLRRDRGHRADRRQRPRPARRLQPPRPHRDAARDARRRQRVRRHPATATSIVARRRAGRPADDPRRAPRAARRRARSVMPAGTGIRDGTDDGDRRRPWPLARTPRSRSSSSASAPA